MFALKLKDSFLDLSESGNINLTLSCPIFDRDRIARAFTLPFNLPLTPRNRIILNHQNRLDSRLREGKIEKAELWIAGNLWTTGDLVVVKSDSETDIEVSFRVAPVSILEAAKTFRINEILETITFGATGVGGTISYQMINFPTTYSIGFGPSGAVASYTPASGESLMLATLNFGSAIAAAVPGALSGASSGVITLNAGVINSFPVVGTGNLTFLTYQDEAENDFLGAKAHVESVVATPVATHAFPQIRWIGFYAEKNTPLAHPAAWTETMNPIVNGVLLSNPATDAPYFPYSLLPLPRLPYIFEKIRVKLGLDAFAGVWLNEADVQALLVLTNYDLLALRQDRTVNSDGTSGNFRWRGTYRQKINLNDHVPEMTAQEFLTEIADFFQLWFDYQGGSFFLNPKVQLLRVAPPDWTDFVQVDVIRTLVEQKGFSLRLARNKDERFAPVAPDETGQLDNLEKLPARYVEELKVGAIQVSNLPLGPFIGYRRRPTTFQKGASDAYGFEKKPFPLQLLIDRGNYTTNAGDTYTYATNDDYKPNSTGGKTQVGTLSLQLGGTNGLYNRWHKDVIELNDAPEVTFTAILPITEIYRLQNWENARVRFFHPLGEITVVLKKIQVALSAGREAEVVECRVDGLIQ